MRLVLLGDPVDHSLSPAIHQAGLAAAGIEGVYEARQVDVAGLAEAFAEVRHGRVDGANVTMPHKAAAFASCDRVAQAALRTGAVNTVVSDRGMVLGHNTDVLGVASCWTGARLPEDGPVHVLGAGGAAAAVVVALEGRDLLVSSRDRRDAEDLLSRTRTNGRVVPWGVAVPGAVLVNATPIGMAGETPPITIDEAAGLFDMAYGTEVTPLVTAAVSAGIPTVPGPEMLLHQAVESFELWTGVAAPMEEMRRALEEELARRRAPDEESAPDPVHGMEETLP